MKKIILAVLSLVVMASYANAQVTMRIEMENGKQMDFPVSTVKQVTWITNESSSDTPDVSPSGVQAVDLGLPSGIKWANMNIGAESPEDYGDYFAWGETTGYKDGKNNFSEDTYKYYLKTTEKDKDGFDVTTSGYTKYVTKKDASKNGYDGFYDDKAVLEPEDDAAYVNWGGDWRMPTKKEQDELLNGCTWEWAELKGVKGYKVIGPNGNFIFLPAAGFRYDSGLGNAGSYGYYWSSSLHSGYSYDAYYLYFSSGDWRWDYRIRYRGHSVRAVCP